MSQFNKSNSFISLEQGVKVTFQKMISHQQRGEYQDAERCRVEWEHRKEELKIRQIYEMEMRHKREKTQMNNDMSEELKRLDDFWNNKMLEFHQQSEQNIASLTAKHNEECLKLEESLSLQLSTKVKESSQLLNLRKMEEQMAKQKNYVEAHRVQQKIKKLFVQQEQTWLQKRSDKINQALLNLRNKQANEVANLKQRIKTTGEDNTKEHHFESLRINQRYENTLNDQKAEQEREILSFKGEFRTLGGSPTQSPSKSKVSEIKV